MSYFFLFVGFVGSDPRFQFEYAPVLIPNGFKMLVGVTPKCLQIR